MKQTKPQPGGIRTPELIQAEIADREKIRHEEQLALDRTMAERPSVLVNGTDAELRAIDDRQAEHRRTIERQDAGIDALRAEMVEGERDAEQGRRSAIYAEAKTKSEAAAVALAKTYAKAVRDLTDLLRTLADAQLSVAAANASLPAGAEMLLDPEFMARAIHGQPQQVVSEEEVELWCRQDMQIPVAAEHQDNIHDYGGGWGKHIVERNPESVSQGDLGPAYRRRRFLRREIRDSTSGAFPYPLAAGLRLPELKGEGMAWGNPYLPNDPGLLATISGEGEPGWVLARLAEMSATATTKPAQVKRPIRVEFELLGDVIPLPVEKPVPDTTSRRAQPAVRHGSSPYSLPSRAGRR